MGSNLHALQLMPRSRIVVFSSCLPHAVLLAREPYLERSLPNLMTTLAVQNLSLLLGIPLHRLKLRRRSNTNVSTKPENPFTSDTFYGNHAFCGIRLFAQVLHIPFEIFRILFGSFQNGFKFACIAINAKVSNCRFFFLPTA